VSGPPPNARRVRRLLKSLRAGPVPDPGHAYWASFAARLRPRLTEAEAPPSTSLRLRRPAVAWGGMALGLAASLAIAGVLWQSAPPKRETAPEEPISAEHLETLPADVLDRTLDEVIGFDGDETGGADALGDEDRRRLLESLRLEVAETGSPQAMDAVIPEARLS